jgi:nicotinate-nucleotide pyrophosphorylase (carboxylating)
MRELIAENRRLIRLALEEDIGSGDVTTNALIEPDRIATAVIFAKEPLIIAGVALAQEVFTTLDSAATFDTAFQDGDPAQIDDEILKVSGTLRALLTGERTALNFLQRLSGIATLARRYVDRIEGSKARVTDTRKTTPGWRSLEKYAVKIGGAHNHRFGLYDGILIKDNHIEACGGIRGAVAKVRMDRDPSQKIEVEVSSLEQVDEALESGADIIMLDNMDLSDIRKSVSIVKGRALLEVSGGVTLDRLPEIAASGVDIISIGALTHSARAVDISMRVIV